MPDRFNSNRRNQAERSVFSPRQLGPHKRLISRPNIPWDGQTAQSACQHGLFQGCNTCDAPIGFVLTDFARRELEADRLALWHAQLRAASAYAPRLSPAVPSAHLRGEA